MKRVRTMLSIGLAFLLTFSLQAQDGRYDLRFVQIASKQADVALVEIEIKAHSISEEFHLADQNFRFTFNEMAVMPHSSVQPTVYVQSELEVAGFIGQSLYDAHHLNGSVGNTISYNVELLSGEGILLNADQWTKVGRLAFQLTAPEADLGLVWKKIEDFPSTFIAQKVANILSRADDGDYFNTATTVDTEDPSAIDGNISVFPNPAKADEALTITLNSVDVKDKASIMLNDATGRTIAQQPIIIIPGSQTYEFVPVGLAAGTYWLSIKSANWQSVAKAVVIKK